MHFQTAILSEKAGRAINQDYAAYSELDNSGCWVLADGLGGHVAGEIAAKLAAESILQVYTQYYDRPWIEHGIERAHKTLHEQQKRSAVRSSMRTTIVVLTCLNEYAYWAHVGDSRLYHFRDGQLLAQTKDHSVCQALVNAGEITAKEIRFHEDRNRLYRVLGAEGAAKPTINNDGIPLEHGDAFLLCSDGFWEVVTEEKMQNTRMLASSALEWLYMMEAVLKEQMTERHDNYSAIAILINKNKHTTMR